MQIGINYIEQTDQIISCGKNEKSMKLFDLGNNDEYTILKKSDIELPNGFKRSLVCDVATTICTSKLYKIPHHLHFVACGDEVGNICVWRA